MTQTDPPAPNDPDASPPDLALALDAVLDEVVEALGTGDVEQATQLVTAAEATSDALLEALGVPPSADPDDAPGEG